MKPRGRPVEGSMRAIALHRMGGKGQRQQGAVGWVQQERRERRGQVSSVACVGGAG